jgi:4-amino-4-deoxychorismate lyase
MCLLVESIKILDGKAYNVEYHQERLSRSMKDLFGVVSSHDLGELIKVPDNCKNGLYKCRIVYSTEVRAIEYHPYQIGQVNTLKLVCDDEIGYAYKFVDRENLSRLYTMRGTCDDILIIKKGWVTDSFYSNVALYKQGQWHTPSTPLLKGTKREKLIREGILKETAIAETELVSYEKISLINSMLELGDIELPSSSVVMDG